MKKTGVLQSYTVTVSIGQMTHTYAPPGGTPKQLRSEFQLREGADRRVQPSLSEQLRGKMMKEQAYKQIVQLGPNVPHYDHDLIAATRVRFFPWPEIKDTVYLIEADDGRLRVPIGVARYESQ